MSRWGKKEKESRKDKKEREKSKETSRKYKQSKVMRKPKGRCLRLYNCVVALLSNNMAATKGLVKSQCGKRRQNKKLDAKIYRKGKKG